MSSWFKPGEQEDVSTPPSSRKEFSMLDSFRLDGKVEELFLDKMNAPTDEWEAFLNEWYHKDKNIHKQLIEVREKNEKSIKLDRWP